MTDVLTNCWNCSQTYSAGAVQCPACLACNANFNLAQAKKESLLDPTPPSVPEFIGWMLWNIVWHYHDLQGASRPIGIFEDQPKEVQAAWTLAAGELQQRAQSLGRLV